MIKELINQRDNQYRSQKSMQQMYAWKRWQMFTMMRNIIASVNETKQTGIDMKVHKLCERFITEEHLILRYSQDNGVPANIAKDQMHLDKVYKLKLQRDENEIHYTVHSNRADENSARIEDYRVEIETLKFKNTELMLELPSLETQNKLFE